MTVEFLDRLVKHIQFLEDELTDYEQFKNCSREEYLKNRNKRRDMERWIENIMNSTVDISRIILSIEKGDRRKTHLQKGQACLFTTGPTHSVSS